MNETVLLFEMYRVIQKERLLFWEGIVSVVVRKTFQMNMVRIPNCYRVGDVGISRPNPVTFLFVGLDEERSLQKKGGYSRRIAR